MQPHFGKLFKNKNRFLEQRCKQFFDENYDNVIFLKSFGAFQMTNCDKAAYN